MPILWLRVALGFYAVGLIYALVALTLLIAESRPEEKETIVKVIVNLITKAVTAP